MKKLTGWLIAAALIASPAVFAGQQGGGQQQAEDEQQQGGSAESMSRQGGKSGSMASDEQQRGSRHDRGDVVGSIEPEYPTTEEAKYEEEVEGAHHGEGRSMKPAMRATRILGKDVMGPDGRTIGQVDDLVISEGDTLLKAVISVGGFLGIGDKLVAVPYDRLRPAEEDRGKLYLDETRSSLKDMQAFEFSRQRSGDEGMN